ncbi:GGDEF domain-containing protein [Patescibacteria group bacterium]
MSETDIQEVANRKRRPLTKEQKSNAKDFHLKRENQIYRDGLTGAYNRRYLNFKLKELTKENNKESFTFMIFDLDYFKKLDDTYGHLLADAVLKEMVSVVDSSIRIGMNDFVARYGGDEFAVVLSPGLKKDKSFQAAERIRDNIEKYRFRIPGGTTSITISMGVGVWDGSESEDTLIQRVDKALYEAKGNGRNSVVLSEN